MAGLKTTNGRKSVSAFINSVKDETRRRDARRVLHIMKRVTGAKSAM